MISWCPDYVTRQYSVCDFQFFPYERFDVRAWAVSLVAEGREAVENNWGASHGSASSRIWVWGCRDSFAAAMQIYLHPLCEIRHTVFPSNCRSSYTEYIRNCYHSYRLFDKNLKTFRIQFVNVPNIKYILVIKLEIKKFF